MRTFLCVIFLPLMIVSMSACGDSGTKGTDGADGANGDGGDGGDGSTGGDGGKKKDLNAAGSAAVSWLAHAVLLLAVVALFAC